eukprot:gene2332-2645_t
MDWLASTWDLVTVTNLPMECYLVVLPACLTLGGYRDQSLVPGLLPSGLINLTLGHAYDQPIAPGVLPSGLTSLTFVHIFNQPIAPGVLPNGLTSLTFEYYFNEPILSSWYLKWQKNLVQCIYNRIIDLE